jgi:hypothetical protein
MCDLEKMKPETIPGLPEDLPPGERVLWSGGPEWKSLAMHVFHVRAVSIYFVGLAVWKGAAAVPQGALEVATSVGMVAGLGVTALALLCLFAWLMARSTIYTVTDARVVIRAGVALPKSINIPFKVIGSASLRTRKGGDGDIPLQLTGPDRAGYLPLWPHVRPWTMMRAEPMLRGVPDAAKAAEILAGALAEKAGQPTTRIAAQDVDAPRGEAMPGRAAMAHG